MRVPLTFLNDFAPDADVPKDFQENADEWARRREKDFQA